MVGDQIFVNIIAIIIGYLLGTINPAYIFGRLKGIDIRKVGTLNAGSTNALHTLGLKYAFFTALYDVSKGLLSMFIALQLGTTILFAQIAGLAAIVGHVLPFYLHFKGGQGMATNMGLFCYLFYNYLL
jgi:glycerol-3-phosphate acyltransferase PlsY